MNCKKCKKCKEKIPNTAQFCRFCGGNQDHTHKQQQEEEHTPPLGGYVLEENPMDRTLNQMLKHTVRNPMVAVGLALVAGIGLFLCSLSDETRVSMAVGKTFSQLQSETEEMVDNLPVFAFFNEVSQKPYSLSFSSSTFLKQDFSLSLDWKNQQLELLTSLVTEPVHVKMSSDYTSISFSEGGQPYGLTHQTLGRDLNQCAFLSFDADPDYQFQPFTLDVSAYEELQEILLGWATTLLQGMEVEQSKSTKKTMLIDGKERNVSTYLVEFSPDSVRMTLEGMVNDVLHDPELRMQLEQTYMVYSTGNLLGNLLGNVPSFEEMMRNLEENLKDSIAVFVADYASLPTRAFQVYVYKGKMVGLADPYGENLLSFSSAKDFLEGITLGSGVNKSTHSFQISGDVFTYNGNSPFPVYHVEYNFASSENNFHVWKENQDNHSFIVDSTEKNKLWIFYQGDVYFFEKNNLAPDWFSQERDLPPLLNLSKKEAFSLFLSLF